MCGDVEVVADLGQFGHGGQDFFKEFFGWVAGYKSYPFNAVDFGCHFQKVGKAVSFVACGVFVGVYSLAEQGDEFYALARQVFNLVDYCFWRTRDFGAPDIWDDAV